MSFFCVFFFFFFFFFNDTATTEIYTLSLHDALPISSLLFSLTCFLLVLLDPGPCDQGGVREHLCERTRNDGTGQARHRVPEVVLVSAGREGVVHPPWIPRNRHRVALAGALTRSAAAYEADARSLRRTAVTRPRGPVSRGGSALQ